MQSHHIFTLFFLHSLSRILGHQHLGSQTIIVARPKCGATLCSKSFFYKYFMFNFVFCTWTNLALQALIGENKVNIYLGCYTSVSFVCDMAQVDCLVNLHTLISQGIQSGHSPKCLHPCQCILSPSNWSFLSCWKKHMDLCFLSQSMQKVNLIYRFPIINPLKLCIIFPICP